MLNAPAQFSELSGQKPSLMQGSAQALRLTKFKTDPKDQTVSVSDLIATAPNADYDGRSKNKGTIILYK